jgi:hypothetical protein
MQSRKVVFYGVSAGLVIGLVTMLLLDTIVRLPRSGVANTLFRVIHFPVLWFVDVLVDWFPRMGDGAGILMLFLLLFYWMTIGTSAAGLYLLFRGHKRTAISK